MTDKPIIMSAESVRAILALRKTQTRRVIKPQPTFPSRFVENGIFTHPSEGAEPDSFITCPYGQPGDRLWVRETWNHSHSAGELGGREIYYKADGGEGYFGQWKSSMFMPRWASRLTLEVTGIRVERLQEITPEDCEAETGVGDVYTLRLNNYGTGAIIKDYYAELWDALNAKRGHPWDANPWVWVVEFKGLLCEPRRGYELSDLR